MVFAKKLTYPEPVTAYNVRELRRAVINGPETYPGASHVQLEDGTQTSLAQLDHDARVALANQLLTPQSAGEGPCYEATYGVRLSGGRTERGGAAGCACGGRQTARTRAAQKRCCATCARATSCW